MFKKILETAAGISIGTSSVKIIELRRQKKNLELINFGFIGLPQDTIVNREIVNTLALTEAIKSLIRQTQPQSKQVCFGLSGTSVILKRILLEVENLKELRDQVLWEAEQYFPFDFSEVAIDYQLLSKIKDKKADVLMVGTKKSFVQSYINCIADAGLEGNIVDLDYFAMQHIYERNYPMNTSEAVALIDIGASSMKISIVYINIPVFTKEISMGGNELTIEIQKKLNISFVDAETLKIGSQAMPGAIIELLKETTDNYANEIKKVIDFYHASPSGGPVRFILLTGGGSKILNLTTVIEKKIGLPCQKLNPFNGLIMNPDTFKPNLLKDLAPIASIPAGLALRAAEG